MDIFRDRGNVPDTYERVPEQYSTAPPTTTKPWMESGQQTSQPTTVYARAPPIQKQPWVRRIEGFLSNATSGVLRIDLTRPMWTRAPERSSLISSSARDVPQYPPRGIDDRAIINPSSFVQGSQIKIMRYAGTGPVVPSGRRTFDAGLGMQYDMQRGKINPVMRLRILDVIRLKMVPTPIFKLKHMFPIFDTGMAVGLSYHQALTQDVRKLGRGGTWSIRLARVGENTIHFSPDRIELSNQRFTLGDRVDMMFSADLNYPRQIPASDWKEQLNILPTRVGVKVGW